MAVSAVMSHGLKHDEIVEGVARSVSSWSCIRYEFIARSAPQFLAKGASENRRKVAAATRH